jgi:hypothetical protein
MHTSTAGEFLGVKPHMVRISIFQTVFYHAYAIVYCHGYTGLLKTAALSCH